MKIHELTHKPMLEGMVEPNVLLSVRNVLARGRADNLFEYIVIARLLQMLKLGEFYKQSNPLEVNMSTSKDVLDTLKALSPEDITEVARKLYDLLQTKDQDRYYYLVNPHQEFMSWLDLVKSREAND